MDDTQRVWRPLRAGHPSVPPLLVAVSTGAASYAMHVTDLEHVWAERLSRREICMRAFREDTPIDPSVDAEQMSAFLTRIAVVGRAADEGEHDRAEAYALELASEDGMLVLSLTVPLPAPLAPLRWPFRLALQKGAGTVAAAVVVPLLRERRRRQRESAAVALMLRDKDAVIARLADKLEAMGVGLESIFPAVGRRPGGASTSLVISPARKGKGQGQGLGAVHGAQKPLSRAAVAEKVRGLAPFDREQLQRQLQEEEEEEEKEEQEDAEAEAEADTETGQGENKSSLRLASIFGEALAWEDEDGAKSSQQSGQSGKSGKSSDGVLGLDWWQLLGSGSSGRGVLLERTAEPKKNKADVRAQKEEEEEMARKAQRPVDEDDFQAATSQARGPSTPPPPQRESSPPSSPPLPSEPSRPSQPSSPSQRPQPAMRPPPARGKLGRLGGKKKQEEEKEMEREEKKEKGREATPPAKSPDDMGSDTASDADIGEDHEALRAEPPRPPNTTKGGLGRIGKRPEKAEEKTQVIDVPSSPPLPSPREKPRQLPSAKRGLGRIGANADRIEAVEAARKEREAAAAAAEAEMARAKAEEEQKKKEAEKQRIQNVVERNAAPVRKKRKF